MNEQEKYIYNNYLDIPIKRIAKNIGRSQTYVRGFMRRQGLIIPKHIADERKRATQFKKGMPGWNKGK